MSILHSPKAPIINLTISSVLTFFAAGTALFILFDWSWNPNLAALGLISVSSGIMIYSLAGILMPFALITLEAENKKECTPQSVTLMVDGRHVRFKNNCLPKHCKIFFPRRGEYDVLWCVTINGRKQMYSDRINLYDLVSNSIVTVSENE